MTVLAFQALLANLVTTPRDRTVPTYAALKEESSTARGAFVTDLTQLQQDNDRRNAALEAAGEAPYPYLPLSIET